MKKLYKSGKKEDLIGISPVGASAPLQRFALNSQQTKISQQTNNFRLKFSVQDG